MKKYDETDALSEESQVVTVVETSKELAKKAGEPFIGTWVEAHNFSRDNEYIKGGYRINFNTVRRILRSLFMVHNESMNIWSHLAGVVLFVVFVAYIAICITPKISLLNFVQQLQGKFNSTLELPNNLFAFPHLRNERPDVWNLEDVSSYFSNFTFALKEYINSVAYFLLSLRSNMSLHSMNSLMHNLERFPSQIKHQALTLYNRTLEKFEYSDTEEETIGVISRCTVPRKRRASLCPHDRRHPLLVVQRDVSPVLRLREQAAGLPLQTRLRRNLLANSGEHVSAGDLRLRVQPNPQDLLHPGGVHDLRRRLCDDFDARRRNVEVQADARVPLHIRGAVCRSPGGPRGGYERS